MPSSGRTAAIESCYGLALRLARRRSWMYRILPREDYEQEAMLALVIAAGKWNPRRAKLSTFAYRAIEGALINAERAWLHYSRRTKDSPQFLPLTAEDDRPFGGMCEADIEPVSTMYEGEWFARPARMYLLAGLSAVETARLCNCTLNTVHQSVSYWRRRLLADVA